MSKEALKTLLALCLIICQYFSIQKKNVPESYSLSKGAMCRWSLKKSKLGLFTHSAIAFTYSDSLLFCAFTDTPIADSEISDKALPGMTCEVEESILWTRTNQVRMWLHIADRSRDCLYSTETYGFPLFGSYDAWN